MALSNVIQRLTTFLQSKTQKLLLPISAVMLICSAIKRPGMSAMVIASRVINRLPEVGAINGNNIDGSPNIMNKVIYVLCDEMVKALKLEGKVEVGIAPGSITSIGFGTNAGGGMTIVSTNSNAFSAPGIVR